MAKGEDTEAVEVPARAITIEAAPVPRSKLLRRGELAKATGVSQSTLLRAEKRGEIVPDATDENDGSLYSVDRVEEIRERTIRRVHYKEKQTPATLDAMAKQEARVFARLARGDSPVEVVASGEVRVDRGIELLGKFRKVLASEKEMLQSAYAAAGLMRPKENARAELRTQAWIQRTRILDPLGFEVRALDPKSVEARALKRLELFRAGFAAAIVVKLVPLTDVVDGEGEEEETPPAIAPTSAPPPLPPRVVASSAKFPALKVAQSSYLMPLASALEEAVRIGKKSATYVRVLVREDGSGFVGADYTDRAKAADLACLSKYRGVRELRIVCPDGTIETIGPSDKLAE